VEAIFSNLSYGIPASSGGPHDCTCSAEALSLAKATARDVLHTAIGAGINVPSRKTRVAPTVSDTEARLSLTNRNPIAQSYPLKTASR
jgi:hypothetical protein